MCRYKVGLNYFTEQQPQQTLKAKQTKSEALSCLSQQLYTAIMLFATDYYYLTQNLIT